MRIEIRRATVADSERATAIARSAKASWQYPAEWLAAWEADLAITSEQIARYPTFVAEVDGELAGVCQIQEAGGPAMLEHVWVEPARHGLGVGRALVERAQQEARGVMSIVADPHAEDFYLKLGARRVGTICAPMPGAPERVLPLLELDAMRGKDREQLKIED